MAVKGKILLLEIEEVIAMISAFLLIAAVFLPWGKTDHVSILGINGQDSMITIGMGLVALIILLVRRISNIIPLFLGLVTLAVGIYDFVKMDAIVSSLNGNVGAGLYLTVIASFGVVVGAAIDVIRKRKKKKYVAPEGHGSGFKALTWFLLFSIILSGFSGWPMGKVAFAAFDGGDGTIGTPYQISTCSQLEEIGNSSTSYYVLTADVDCTADTRVGGALWNSGAGFAPLLAFNGNFNGSGHTITGMYIYRPSSAMVSLFGSVGQYGIVNNVGMRDVDITGRNLVGGLVGYNSQSTGMGTVRNSYSTGTVTGIGGAPYGSDGIGGLVGYNEGVISDCYSRANVVAGAIQNAAGFVGWKNGGFIRRVYSTGTVSGGGGYTGGLIAQNVGTAIENGLWDTQTSAMASSAEGTGKTTSEMTDTATFTSYTSTPELVDPVYDFVGDPNDDAGTNDYWTIDASRNNGYPYLVALQPPIDPPPDVTAPSIATLFPLDNAVDVSPTSNLTVTFDENVTAVAGKYIVVKQGETVVESVDVTNGSKVTVTGASVEVNLATTLDWTTGYNILIDAGAFTDAALNPIAGISSATAWNFTTATPPVVATLSPTDGATGVSAGSNLVVTFDKNVSAVAGKFLYVKRTAGDTVFETVAVDGIKVSILNAIVTVDLDANLDYSTGYYVTMDVGAFEDTFGNPFAGISSATTWDFATGAAPDVTAPSVSFFSPLDGTPNVSITTDLTLTFDENVTPIAGKYITVMQGESIIQSSEVTNGAVVLVADNVVTMHLSAPLGYSTAYYVLVDVGAFQDSSGNPFAGIASSTTWDFTTLTAPDVTPPSVTSITPADNATGVSITTGLTVVFDENVVAVGGKNMYVMNGGTTVATIAVDGGSVSVFGGTVVVTLPSSLSYSTSYHVTIDSGAFTDTIGNPITGIADSTTWNFTTLDDPTPPDSTPPSVSSFSPLDNATGVSPAANLIINFDENVSAVADKHIYVMQGDSVFQTITATNTDDVSISGSTVTLHMGSLLDYTTEYHVLIDVGAFEDAAHNSYAGIADATTWSFTVVTPVSISTCTELQAISGNLAGHYILTGDVDCQADTHSGGALWNGGLGFEPLGTVNPGVQFTGTFNGQKYAVKNLFINRPAANGVGLFGGLGDGGLIIYAGVQNANITGDNGVGGLLGYSGSGAIVSSSYSTGTVTGVADYDGGLIGYNDTGASVVSSYSTANVSGASYVGGFVGYNKSSTDGGVSNSYSSGSVIGTSGGVGGFVGNNEGTVGNSYSLGTVTGGTAKGFCGANTGTVSISAWNTETSGRGDSDGGVAKTTLEMKTGSTFTDAGWNFSSIWNIGTSTNNGYPYFRWVEFPNVGFSTTSASGLESVTSVNLALTLSSSFPWSVTVSYAVTGGTATGSGSDYTLSSGTATIEAGETSVNVPLAVVNDTTVESDETVIVTISSPTNSALGATTSYTYTITNDDTAAPVDLGGGGGYSYHDTSGDNNNSNNSNTDSTDTDTTTTTDDSSSDTNTNTDTVAEENQTNKDAAEKDALEEAASSTVDLFKDKLGEDKNTVVNDKEVNDAINKYTEDAGNNDSENQIEYNIIYSPGVELNPPVFAVLSGKETDPGTKEKVEQEISENAKNSVSRAIAGSGGSVNAKVEGRNQKVTNKTEVKITLSLREAQALRAVYAAERRDILVLDTSSDVDQDGVADYIQIQNDQPLFNPDVDKDGFSNMDEIFLGGDPKKTDSFDKLVPSKPRITNLFKNKENVVGSNSIFWITDKKIGDNFSIFIVDVKDSSKRILVGSGVIDAHFKSAVSLQLPDGEYFIFVKSDTGVGEVQRIKVDSKLDLEAPSFARANMVVRESQVSVLGGIYAVLHRPLPSSVLALLEPTELDQNSVITGVAKPGELVYVTWKSMVLNSVVIADASSGEFQVQVPVGLENGKHTALAYVVNGKNPWLSNISEMVFGKKTVN